MLYGFGSNRHIRIGGTSPIHNVNIEPVKVKDLYWNRSLHPHFLDALMDLLPQTHSKSTEETQKNRRI